MKKRFLSLAMAAVAIAPMFAKDNAADPVLFSIDGKDVPVSEFEYLYNKNNQQQAEPQTRRQYFDMFLLYKLKVADAVSAGMDTTASFRREYDLYRRDLAIPYMLDKETQQKMLDLSYEMMKEHVDVSHIMLAHDSAPGKDMELKLRLDSIRNEVLAGRADFDEMARQFSVDGMVKQTGSAHMGLVRGTANYPYPFVEAAYTTPIGSISPVVDSGFGYHIIRPEKRVPNEGEVHAKHILKLTRGLDEEKAAEKKAEIDRIYKELKGGASFDSIARVESEDHGSARNGGDLGYFGRGMMVPEFDKVSFELADGEISEPFTTMFGYHIVKREGHRGVPTYEEALPQLQNEISSDERGERPRTVMMEKLRKKYNAHISDEGFEAMMNVIRENDGYDSVAIQRLQKMDTPVVVMDGATVSIAEVVGGVGRIARVSAKSIEPFLRESAQRLSDNRVLGLAVDRLPEENTEYRNLVNEYHDGILLFEVSNNNVWDRSTKDKEGLEKYFNAHKDKYRWNAPKYKGYIIFATSDSIETAARNYLTENKPAADDLSKDLRRQFGKEVKAEKVLAAKGENAIVDAAVFGGAKPVKAGRWAFFFPYDGKVIDQPQEAADVRGAATADYQTELENQWVKTLKSKHKVKINKKVLENLK